MKNIFFTFCFLFCTIILQAQSRSIKGKLTYLNAPLSNAEVLIKGSDSKVKTKSDGSYVITSDEGETLVYSYPGLNTIEILIEDVTSILNIEMTEKMTLLDEVIVKGSNRKTEKELEEEYSYNPNLIKTAWGILDKDTAPGIMRFLGKNEINEVAICILDLLRNEFPGVRVSGDCSLGGTVTVRGIHSVNEIIPMEFNIDGVEVSGDPIIGTQTAGNRSITPVIGGALNSAPPAIFDVDGLILGEAPIWILPSAIERIAVLSSLSLTGRYGSIGAGGVVVINTKTGATGLANTKILDRAKLRNNKYLNDAIEQQDISHNLPSYLIDLNASSTLDLARETYSKNRSVYRSSPFYFIDSYNYFMDKGDRSFANQIIEDNKYLFENHPVYAKALAYHFDVYGESKKANSLYEQIFILRPSYVQSYRDLGESYREVRNFKKSASMYARYHYLLKEGFFYTDSIGFNTIIERDSENLLVLDGDKVMNGLGSVDRMRNSKLSEFEGTRLLFEWNDSEAEFELQFVNPENRFHTWKHTLEANADRIRDEKVKGYSSGEFLIDESLPGKWLININYKGNKKLEPSYLKVTTYYNYGKPSQRKEVNVYRLGLRNINRELFSIINSGLSSTN